MKALEGEPLEWLRERGLSKRIIEEAGLGYVDEPREPRHERFRGAISIPYYDARGRERYLRFRRINGDTPKYEQLAGTKVTPYGVDQADADHVFITEGEIDALTLRQLGHNAVGLPGVNAWQRSWRWLFRDSGLVSIVFDPDEPGRRAAENIAADIAYVGVEVRVVHLPGSKDVNEWYIEDLGVLREVLKP